MLTTPLCRTLGIEHPIISAAMGGATVPEFTAAVSNAGACGQVGLSGVGQDRARTLIRRVRELTDRPFAANVILDQYDGKEIETALDEAVPALFLFWGDPSPWVADAHRRGTRVVVQVGSVAEAAAAAEAGVDVIVAQGVEAGGHVRGTTPLISLVPQVVEAVSPLPVVAAGGIVDGRGLAAALALGADGVLIGTRFLASEEADVHPEYRRRVLAATSAGDTVHCDDLFDVGWPNAAHRVLRNRLVEEWEAAGRPAPGARANEGDVIGTRRMWDGSTVPVRLYSSVTATTAFDVDMERAALWAGMSVGLVRDVKPVGEIVRETVRGAEEFLARLSPAAGTARVDAELR
ncbi:MAG: NAD(P)H-dependent flavin oxidoreductase [Candidatus Limnocylindria bacterium]